MNHSSVTSSQLEYLVAVIEHDTWREAAADVGVSASALSQGLAELERRLGLTLFERDGRRRVPTSEADRVAGHGRRVLAELRALERWASEVRTGAVGEISIGMIDTAAIHHFGDTLVGFRRDNPDLTVRLLVRPSAELLDLLRAGQVDAVVVANPSIDESMTAQPLLDEALHVYAPPGTRVGRPDSWGPWVGFPGTSVTRALTTIALRRRGADYEIVAESSQPAVLREMVQLGMGWCVLPVSDAEREPHALTRAIAEPITSRTLTLVRRIDRVPSPALGRLVDQLTG